MEFSVAIWVQKHGTSTPDWLIVLIFAVGAIPAVIAAIRYDRFLRAGGQIKEQVMDHPFSSALLCLLFLMVSFSTLTTLNKHSKQQATKQPVQQTAKSATALDTPKETPTSSTQSVTKVPSLEAKSKNVAAPTKKAKNTIPITVGADSVGMGLIPPGTKIGDRSVLVGATDSNGNTVIPGGTAVGYGAHADPTSVAIGAGAGGGQQLNPAPSLSCTDGSNCFTDNHGTVIGKQEFRSPKPGPPISELSIEKTLATPPAPPVQYSDDSRIRRAQISDHQIQVATGQITQGSNPGLSITFQVAERFPNPMFKITCDRPCQGGKAAIQDRGGWRSMGQNTFTGNGEPNVVILELRDIRTLDQGISVSVGVTSLDSQPLNSARGL